MIEEKRRKRMILINIFIYLIKYIVSGVIDAGVRVGVYI